MDEDKSRVIDTSEERNIDEKKFNTDDPEKDKELELEEPESEPIEKEQLDTQEPIEIQDEKDYIAEALDFDPVLKQSLTYAALKLKQKEESLLPDEQQFVKDYEEQQAAQEKLQKEKQEENLKNKELDKQKEQVLKEYLEAKKSNPEAIARLDEQKLALTGEENLFQIIKFVKILNKAKKKGGKVLVQVFKSRKVLISWTDQELLFVEFISKDEHGNQTMDICRFNEYKYSLEGTPVAVLFAVQGYAEGFDFYAGFKKNLDSETVNNLMLRAYHAGFLKGAEIRDPNTDNFLEKYAPILLIIIVICTIATVFFAYQMWDKLKFLDSAALKNIALMAKQYADTNGGLIVQQAIDTNKAVIIS